MASRADQHVCLIAPTLHYYLESRNSEEVGGRELQQYFIAKGLSDRGFHVSAIVEERADIESDTVDGIRVHQQYPRDTRLINYLGSSIKILRSMHKVDADTYYVRGQVQLFILAAIYCYLLNKKIVFGVASDTDVDREVLRQNKFALVRLLYSQCLQSASEIICQTEYQADRLRRYFGVEGEIVPNGYQVPPESEIRPHDERSFVLWVGRIDQDQKKPERFLDLAREVENCEFVMIGNHNNSREYYERIETEAEDISNLNFVGFVAPDSINRYFKNAIALVNTSDYEGFSNTFLEAWRYATPVVSLHHSLGGVLERECIGYHSGSFDTLVKNIRTLCEEKEERKEVGWNARNYMEKNYSMEQLVNRHERVIFGSTRESQG